MLHRVSEVVLCELFECFVTGARYRHSLRSIEDLEVCQRILFVVAVGILSILARFHQSYRKREGDVLGRLAIAQLVNDSDMCAFGIKAHIERFLFEFDRLFLNRYQITSALDRASAKWSSVCETLNVERSKTYAFHHEKNLSVHVFYIFLTSRRVRSTSTSSASSASLEHLLTATAPLSNPWPCECARGRWDDRRKRILRLGQDSICDRRRA